MERAVLWAVVAVGLMGWLISGAASGAPPFGALARRDGAAARPHTTESRRGVPLPFILAAMVLVVFVFLLTLRENAPFGIGQGFGRGWLAGGLAALGGAWACGACSLGSVPAGTGSSHSSKIAVALRVAAPLWLGLVALSAVSLWGREVLLDALGGVMVAYVVVTLVLVGGTGGGIRRENSLLLLSGVVFTAAVGGTVLLGTFRDFRIVDLPRGTWGAVALALGLTVAFVPLLGALAGSFVRRSGAGLHIARWGATALLLLGVARGLSLKLVDEGGLVVGVVIGLAAGLTAWWSARDDSTSASFAAPFAILAVLAGLAASFVTLQGVGSGLMLLAFWPAVLFALSDALESENAGVPASAEAAALAEAAPAPPRNLTFAPAMTLLQVAAFGAVTVLYRGVQTRFHDDLRGVAITDQYALWGFLAGAVVPALLAGLQERGRGAAAWITLARTLLAGIAMVALPAVLTLFFGPKCALALLMGLAVGCVVRPLREETSASAIAGTPVASGALPVGWALFGALLIMQWTHRLLPLAEFTRAQKLRTLSILLCVVVVLWIVAEWSARLAERRASRSPLATPV